MRVKWSVVFLFGKQNSVLNSMIIKLRKLVSSKLRGAIFGIIAHYLSQHRALNGQEIFVIKTGVVFRNRVNIHHHEIHYITLLSTFN